MKIYYDPNKYYEYAFFFPFSREALSFCRSMKEIHGWKDFNFYNGLWRFKNPILIGNILKAFPNASIDDVAILAYETAKIRAEKDLEIANEAERLKTLDSSDIVIPGLKGELYGYQKIGVEFFMNSGGRAILADTMGCGKTAQTLAYILKTGFKKTLVVCPASVKSSWEKEIKKWTSLKPLMVGPKTNINTIEHSDVDVYVINYDILRKKISDLMKVKFECVVFDEGQLLKSAKAIRSKCAKAISRSIPSNIILSGTPLLSRPIELFNLLNIIDPLVWNDYYDYAKRYCEGTMGFWGFEAKGASNLDELSRRISRYFLRRTKDQVLKELPPKILVPTDIVLEGTYERDYSKASNSFAKFLKENKKKKDPEVLKSLQAERLVKINYLREIAVNGRVDAAREIIDSVVDSGQKVLVFSSFNAPLEELNKIYPDSVMITGKTPVEERGAIVERFQKNPSCKIFLGGYKSAGTGITLTASSVVVTLDYPWNPADIDQAIDRVHRPGVVADSITIYQMSSPNTIDDYIKKLLDKKRTVFNQVVDTQNSKIGDINDDDLINLIEEQSRIRKIKN